MDIKIYDKLATKYDFATKIISFGIEEVWRWIFVKEIKKLIKDGILIDVASATGEMAKKLNFKEMYLIEPSQEMNKIALKKLSNGCKIEKFEKKYKILCKDKKIEIIKDIAEEFKIEKKVDLITAFMAIRNFDNIQKGINNLKFHLKKGGYVAIVEMVKSDFIFAKLILWYMNNIVPLIAGLLFGMKKEYKLLGKSINNLDESDIIKNLEGFEIVKQKKLFFIATLVIAKKNER